MYDNIRAWEMGHGNPILADRIPKYGDVAIDIGANIGVYAMDLSRSFKYVLAFEPGPAFEQLERIAATKNNVTAYRNAIGASLGDVEMTTYRSHEHLSAHAIPEFSANRGEPTGTMIVEQIPLDQTLEYGWVPPFHSIDFVKVDVEGAEVDVLRGADRFVRHVRPMWMIEVHTKENRDPIAKILEENGYNIELVPHPQLDPAEGIVYFVARP